MNHTEEMAEETAERADSEKSYEAHEEHMPDGPQSIGGRGWKATFRRSIAEFMADGGIDLAAALTFFSMLSLFPAVLALSSTLGVFGQGTKTTTALLDVVARLGVGEQSLKPIRDYLAYMQTSGGAGLALLVGLVGALWAASNYVNAFSRAMNRIYDVKEGRPLWKRRPLMLLITLGVLLMVALLGLSLVFTGGVAQSVGSVVGLGDTAVSVWGIVKWPVMFIIVVLLTALLYWGTPNVRQPKFRWISPGALLAIMVWMVATAGFFLYVANFPSYNKTYGTLAGLIVLLLWLWLTNIALLFGAEFDAELERTRELQAGLPAEETIQLPARDSSVALKTGRRHAKLVQHGRKVRILAGRRRRAQSEDHPEGP